MQITRRSTFNADDGSGIGGESSVSCDALDKRVIVLESDSVDVPIISSLDVSQLKALAILCTAACTVKTNNAVTPDDEFEVAANQDFTWIEGDGANPFVSGVDVTGLFVTCADGGTLTIWFGFDPTV